MSLMPLSHLRKNITSTPFAKTYGKHKTAWGILEVALFLSGCLINALAYESFESITLATIFLTAGMILLLIIGSNGYYERKIFFRTFAVGWVMAGVAAVYANFLGDPSQLYSDSRYFYEMASGQSQGMNLVDLRLHTEGAGAIILWREVYDAFAAIGFERQRYVGVLINVSAVAFTGVIAIKIARQIYGEDISRFRRLCLIFACCGLFWLFAGIHLRDSFILLAVSILAYAWVIYLSRPGLGLRLLYIILASLVAIEGMSYLRTEFAFVPVAMAFSGIAAIVTGRKKSSNATWMIIIVGLAFILSVGLFVIFSAEIAELLVRGNTGYAKHGAASHGQDSLGMSLIVNQVLPVRLVLGTVYLYIFPIPFWSGFQLETAYHLFKSLNVIFFYFFTPLLVLAVWKLWSVKSNRTYSILFLFFCTLGFTLAVSGTSLETRHFGAFYVPMFLLALLPDLRLAGERILYQRLLLLFISIILGIHVVWATLKFL